MEKDSATMNGPDADPGRYALHAGRLRAMRKSIERSILKSRFMTEVGGALAYAYMGYVHRTNARVDGSDDLERLIEGQTPVIVAYWHGQHIFAPLLRPKHLPMAALISKNADAELNAALLRRAGVQTVRGSGGRGGPQRADKGGARAMIQLKRLLDEGVSVNMIADISKGEARRAGLGIVTLAKLSGRPILPLAFATTRRKVMEKTWDKTTINLPYGKSAVAAGPLIRVAANADDAELEDARDAVTDALNAVTERAEILLTPKLLTPGNARGPGS